MPYRSPKAQNIHDSLLAYLYRINQQNLNNFKKALLAADEPSLMEKSINNHSHLIDILHLSYEIIPDPLKASNIALTLFKLIMQRVERFPEVKFFLLTSANDAGFTPLHEILTAGYYENTHAYFDELKNIIIHGIMTLNQYQEFLIKPILSGLSPLHQAAYSGNFKVIQFYFEELERTHTKETIYNCLMTQAKGHLPSCPAQSPEAPSINNYLDQKRVIFSKSPEKIQKRTVHVVHLDSSTDHRKIIFRKEKAQSIHDKKTKIFSSRKVIFSETKPERKVIICGDTHKNMFFKHKSKHKPPKKSLQKPYDDFYHKMTF